MTKLTKKEVLKMFNEEIKPLVIERYGKADKIAISTEWSNYTDHLHKDGKLTDNQVQNWTNPFN